MSVRHGQISRVRRPRQDAKSMYDRYSRFYDWIGGQFERKYALAGVQALEVKPGEHVLEIGYGTGHMLVVLANLVGSSGKIWGIDISEGMYNIALRRIQRKGLEPRVRLLCDDALNLPFDSDFFDVVFMSFTLELFDTPEIPLLLTQCRRILHKDGRIGVVALSKKNQVGRINRIYEWLHHYFPKWIDCRPIFLSQILSNAGFQVKRELLFPMFGLQVELVIARNHRKTR